MQRLQELVRLHRLGTGCRDVARLLGMSPNTERTYREALAAAGLLEGDAGALPELGDLKGVVAARLPLKESPQYVSSVEPWHEQIAKLLRKGAQAKAIYDRLGLDEPTFEGSLSAVKRLVRRLQQAEPVRADDVIIRVETVAGHIAQVDFGYVGRLLDAATGRLRKAWVFVMTLAHSRHMFADVVFDQCAATWQQLHVAAFEFFGGVPETIVPDNLKAAVIRAAFGLGDEPSLNRTYRELARHYGFKVDPAPARKPQKKGKVESNVGYVKNNYFATCTDQDLHVVRAGLHRWVLQVAGLRAHGTTGRAPLALFEQEERGTLLPLAKVRYEPVTWYRGTVGEDAHVLFDRRTYSVPWTLLGQEAWVRATASTVVVYVGDERVSTHDRRAKGTRSTHDAHLPEGRRDLRHRDEAWWLAEADSMGAEVGALMREVLASDRELSLLSTVQAMVLHLRNFPAARAKRACQRASRFGNYKFPGLRDMLLKGLDFEPLPGESDALPGALSHATHARDLRELLDAHLSGAESFDPEATEAPHELH